MFGELFDLPPAVPYDPVKFRGDVGRFLTPINWVGVAFKNTWGGIKCKTEFGALIYGVQLFSPSQAGVPVDVRVGINMDAGTVVGIRRRDEGLDLYGNVKNAIAEAFIAQNATQLGSMLHRQDFIVNGPSSPFIPLNWYLQNNEEITVGHEGQNIGGRCTFWGVEFYTPEVRDYFLQRMR